MNGENINTKPIGLLVKGEKLNPEYFNFMIELLNDSEINRMEGKVLKVHSILDQERWYNLNKNNINCDFWVFLEKLSNKPIGYFSFKKISNDPIIGHIGIKLSTNFQGKGFGKDILNAIESYYFKNYKVDKLVSHIVVYNLASIHLFVKSNGWKQTGLNKDTVIIGNEKFNQITIEMSRNDFFKKENVSLIKQKKNDI
jgi:RimJ/RimL family protein N-acetyltransferase